MDLDEELKTLLELFRLVRYLDVVFSDRVDARFHPKVFFLDAHIIALVQLAKNFLGGNWSLCYVFVDF